MTHDKFMDAVEKTYGKYENQYVRAMVCKFIADWNEEELDRRFAKLVRGYSTKWKIQPDVAVLIEVCGDDNNADILATRAWMLLNEFEDGQSIICTDLVAQEVVMFMGGWDAFCGYREENGKWCMKDFMSHYARLNPMRSDFKPRVLRGWQDTRYNPTVDMRKVLIAGDREKGLEYIRDIATASIEDRRGVKRLDFKGIVAGLEAEQ